MKEVSNLCLPVWADTMQKHLRIKNVDRWSRLFKQAWLNLVNPDLGRKESQDLAYLELIQLCISLEYIMDVLVKIVVQARF